MTRKGPDYSSRKSHPPRITMPCSAFVSNFNLPSYSYWIPYGFHATLPNSLVRGIRSAVTCSCMHQQGPQIILSTLYPHTVFSVIPVAPITLPCRDTKQKAKPLFLASWVLGTFQSLSKVLGPRAEFLASGLKSAQFLTVLILQRRLLFCPTSYLWEILTLPTLSLPVVGWIVAPQRLCSYPSPENLWM